MTRQQKSTQELAPPCPEPAEGAQPAEKPAEEGQSVRDRVQAIIENMINPAVGMHGGFVRLVDVKDGVVFVQMGGGCQGCAASQMTLRNGIEGMLKEEVPEITEVRDATDHDAGSDPYYK